MFVESAVAVLLAVTIGYCVILNARLQRLHRDRETMAKSAADLVQATMLANAAVKELKTAALEADTKLTQRLDEARGFEADLATKIDSGSQLIARIAKITAAARNVPLPEPEPAAAKQDIEPQSRLQSALQQLAMRPGIGGRAA
jgi:hypothetical protein